VCRSWYTEIMKKPEYKRGEEVYVICAPERPLAWIKCTVTNILRINSRWDYEVTESDGTKHQVLETMMERRVKG
jgi:hypothetical protein